MDCPMKMLNYSVRQSASYLVKYLVSIYDLIFKSV